MLISRKLREKRCDLDRRIERLGARRIVTVRVGAQRCDEIAEDGRRGGAAAGAGPRNGQGTGIARDDVHDIVGPADARERMPVRNEDRTDRCGTASRGCNEANAAAGHLRGGYIGLAYACDSGRRNTRGNDREAEGELHQKGEFVRRIPPLDVPGGIRFGKPTRLRVGQRFRVLGAVFHRAENGVASSIDDAADRVDAVAGKALFDQANDRNRAARRGLIAGWFGARKRARAAVDLALRANPCWR